MLRQAQHDNRSIFYFLIYIHVFWISTSAAAPDSVFLSDSRIAYAFRSDHFQERFGEIDQEWGHDEDSVIDHLVVRSRIPYRVSSNRWFFGIVIFSLWLRMLDQGNSIDMETQLCSEKIQDDFWN